MMILFGFSCPAKSRSVDCSAPQYDNEFVLAATGLMIVVGFILGYREVIRQATDSNPRCPHCNAKLPTINTHEPFWKFNKEFAKCTSCGEVCGTHGEEI